MAPRGERQRTREEAYLEEADVKEVLAAGEPGVRVLLLERLEEACAGAKVGDARRGRDAGAWVRGRRGQSPRGWKGGSRA